MRCDLVNMLRHARRCIDSRRDGYGYEAALEQLQEHVQQVRDGEVSLDEFADFYMIRKGAK